MSISQYLHQIWIPIAVYFASKFDHLDPQIYTRTQYPHRVHVTWLPHDSPYITVKIYNSKWGSFEKTKTLYSGMQAFTYRRVRYKFYLQTETLKMFVNVWSHSSQLILEKRNRFTTSYTIAWTKCYCQRKIMLLDSRHLMILWKDPNKSYSG